MSLEIKINDDIKSAMRAKDRERLAALRAIKSALLLEKTGKDHSTSEIPESVELQLLQKQVKQRMESAEAFKAQNRDDLAEEELAQASIIKEYLPTQMSDEDLEKEIQNIITTTGAASMKDMGKVMGMASKSLAGKADNKRISSLVKSLLS